VTEIMPRGASDRGSGASWKTAALVAVGAWVLFGLGVVFYFGISYSPCSRVALREIPSDGDLIAVVFTTDCGATTQGATSVAVKNRSARTELSDLDALFRLGGLRDDLNVAWTRTPEARGAHSLAIVYPDDREVWLKAVVWNGLQVSYAAK